MKKPQSEVSQENQSQTEMGTAIVNNFAVEIPTSDMVLALQEDKEFLERKAKAEVERRASIRRQYFCAIVSGLFACPNFNGATGDVIQVAKKATDEAMAAECPSYLASGIGSG